MSDGCYPRVMYRSASRRGSILIIVVGLATLMLTSFLVITRQLRAEVNDGVLVMREVQARAMLPSALAFILEAGRLGHQHDQECYGWTDIRDGGVGPRGPRSANGDLPPEIGGSQWPALGSRFRADLCVWERPPLAILPTAAPNPIQAPEGWVEVYEAAADPQGTGLYGYLNPRQGNGDAGFVRANPANAPESLWSEGARPILFNDGLREHWPKIWSLIFKPMDDLELPYHHSLTVQPVADTIADFRQGDLRPRPGSQDLAWFRIYREVAEDHDGDGRPWFDTVPLGGHAVFILACGAGGSRGFRDWAEVQAAGADDLFLGDVSFFDELRGRERILFYRVKWSAFTGGGGDAVYLYSPTDLTWKVSHDLRHYWTNLTAQRRYHGGSDKAHTQRHTPDPLLNTLGTIEWIERLEYEPTDGTAPGQGKPVW